MKLWMVTPIFSFIILNVFAAGNQNQPSFSRIPRELNEKAITTCLPRLKGYLNDDETSNLGSLKTKIETIFGMRRSFIQYRELIYKTVTGEKWKVEFYLAPDSKWPKEKYRLKFFKFSDAGEFVAVTSSTKEDNITKETLLNYAQAEEIVSDERWEKFGVPADPTVSYKMKDFKLFEVLVMRKAPKSKLFCNIAGGHSFCQCTTD